MNCEEALQDLSHKQQKIESRQLEECGVVCMIKIDLLKNHEKLYLFAFNSTITQYCQSLGWKKIGIDEFKSHPVTLMEIDL